MTLLCMVALQHTYHDWLKVVAKTVAKHTQQNQIILKLLTINTQYVASTLGEEEISQRAHIRRFV